MTSTFRDGILSMAFTLGHAWLKKKELKEIGDLLEPFPASPTYIFNNKYIKCKLTPKGMLVAAASR